MRAIWTGFISFGLVTVPVKLFTAVRENDIAFKQVERTTARPISFKRVNEDGDEVPFENIAKGWEVADDQFIVIEPDELAAIAPPSNKTIMIDTFVEDVPSVYLNKSYYLAPGKAGAKGYKLLATIMEEKGLTAVGKVCLRDKEHVVAVRSVEGVLQATTLYYDDAVTSPGAIPVEDADVSEDELRAAESLIDTMRGTFDPDAYENTHREAVAKLIEAKVSGVELDAPAPAQMRPAEDIMSALSASLAALKEEV